MTTIQSPALPSSPEGAPQHGGEYSDIVDFILGITFQIWEQRQVEAILEHYDEGIDVFSLEGVTQGAASMVDQTLATLEAFPDRLLLGDDVIWSGDLARGFSSHRITSPMTNRGDTIFGPATGKQVLTTNIADCEITDGRISREWLLRDNLALVTQLGFDPLQAGRALADRFDDVLREWQQDEFTRVMEGREAGEPTLGEAQADAQNFFARQVLESCWVTGATDQLENAYAPYCVLTRAPLRLFSGRREILGHYAGWRKAFPDARLSIDHVCSQPHGNRSRRVAVRWSVAAHHRGPFAVFEPGGKPVYVVGVTHWKVLNGRIVAEWTVFDELALGAQALDPAT